MANPAEADEVESEEEPAPKKNWRRELEDRANLAEEKASQLERELAFTKAGLDHLSDKQVKALSAAHDGDITAEALKATADELGFGSKPELGESTPAPQVPDHSAEAAELAALANSPASDGTPTGALTSQEAIDATIKSFDKPDDLMAWMRENVALFEPG